MRVIMSEIFDKSQKIEDLEVSQILYVKSKPESMFEVVKLFMATIEEKHKG